MRFLRNSFAFAEPAHYQIYCNGKSGPGRRGWITARAARSKETAPQIRSGEVGAITTSQCSFRHSWRPRYINVADFPRAFLQISSLSPFVFIRGVERTSLIYMRMFLFHGEGCVLVVAVEVIIC